MILLLFFHSNFRLIENLLVLRDAFQNCWTESFNFCMTKIKSTCTALNISSNVIVGRSIVIILKDGG